MNEVQLLTTAGTFVCEIVIVSELNESDGAAMRKDLVDLSASWKVDEDDFYVLRNVTGAFNYSAGWMIIRKSAVLGIAYKNL